MIIAIRSLHLRDTQGNSEARYGDVSTGAVNAAYRQKLSVQTAVPAGRKAVLVS